MICKNQIKVLIVNRRFTTIYALVILLSLLISFTSEAQVIDEPEKKYASPSVKNMPLGKAFEFKYHIQSSFDIDAEGKTGNIGNAESKIGKMDNFEFDLKLPLFLRDKTILITGLEFNFDEYNFRNSENLSFEFFRVLDNEQLRVRKLKFYLTRSLNEKQFLFFRTTIGINGEIDAIEDVSVHRFLKYSLLGIYGWKYDNLTAYGVGIFFNFTLGRPSVFPIFLWNKYLNSRWGFESRLPAKFTMRYTPNPKYIINFGYKVDGASYRISTNEQPLAGLADLELRKSELRFFAGAERQIYDFIWAGVSAGFRQNLVFDVTNNDLFKDADIIENNLAGSFFFEFSIFIVPNQTIKNALKN